MTGGRFPDGLRLTEEEAYALLGLCLTSPTGLDATSEKALRKLADFCTSNSHSTDNHLKLGSACYPLKRELGKAGA